MCPQCPQSTTCLTVPSKCAPVLYKCVMSYTYRLDHRSHTLTLLQSHIHTVTVSVKVTPSPTHPTFFPVLSGQPESHCQTVTVTQSQSHSQSHCHIHTINHPPSALRPVCALCAQFFSVPSTLYSLICTMFFSVPL